jgi:hypothetical protein
MNWVLIIFMFTANGELVEKIPVGMYTKGSCEQALYSLPRRGENPAGYRFKGKCVTKEHWTGKKKMKDVPLD